jgi:hypothetical protein
MTGLKINYTKSELISLNLTEQEGISLTNILRGKLGTLPFKFRIASIFLVFFLFFRTKMDDKGSRNAKERRLKWKEVAAPFVNYYCIISLLIYIIDSYFLSNLQSNSFSFSVLFVSMLLGIGKEEGY